MFNAYNLQIYMPLGFLGYIWREIQSNLVHVEEVLNLLNLDELIPEKQKPDECRIKAGEIEFKNVSFTYDKKLEKKDQIEVMSNLSFKIKAGMKVGIVGQTGSGKSTIMRMLYMFYDISGGEILIDGQNIKDIRLQDLRQNIAIVPQDCVLFNDTIMYNIAYGAISNPEIAANIDKPEKEEELIA